MTVKGEEAEERTRAREDLSALVKILKRAGVSQNEVARSAQYSSGYVTQLLSKAYPVVKLTPSAIARMVSAVDMNARRVRPRLTDADLVELDQRLAGLRSRYQAERREVYGLDGERLNRPAANYIASEVDFRLLEDITEHSTYGVVQVTGPPGQGKSWALANMGLQASASHEICPIDFTRLSPDELNVRSLLVLARELRRRHQSYWSDIEAEFDDAATLSGDDVGVALLSHVKRCVTEDAPQHDVLNDALTTMSGAISRLLADRATYLRRPSTVPLGESRRDERAAFVAYRDFPPPDFYFADDLADDLLLLLGLAIARSILVGRSVDDPVPDKLLLLLDRPDVNPAGITELTQMLREQATLVRRRPELDHVLVALARSAPAPVSASVSSSKIRRLYWLRPFSEEEFDLLVRELRSNGWLRQVEATTDELFARCLTLGGLNRRLTCLYLDHCHSRQAFYDIDDYLGQGEGGDRRARDWISPWAMWARAEINAQPPAVRDAALVACELNGSSIPDRHSRSYVKPPAGGIELEQLVERLGVVVGRQVPVFQSLVWHLIQFTDLPAPDAEDATSR